MKFAAGLPLWWWLAAAAAVLLRLAGIAWGLPHTFNADEPHLVHLAVSFGGGSLAPYHFKYPTLWPYLLFFFYGLYFLAWSGLGIKHSLSDFVGLYAYDPAGFYLIGRLLSAFFGLLGVGMVWKAERELRGERGLAWAALLLAFAPVLVELAHSLKPDSLMFFLVSAGWSYALRVYRGGTRASHWACGGFFGLAVSSQYTALPAVLALPLAHFLGLRKMPRRYLAEGLAACAACFLAGSPFVVMDFPRFWANLRDFSDLAGLEAWDRGLVLRTVLSNLGSFAGPGSLAGLAALAGLGRLLRTQRALAAVLAGPILLYVALLANNPDGSWPRYLLGGYPALALLAAEGLAWLGGGLLLRAVLAVAALLPGLWRSVLMDREMMLPDTRPKATEWIQKHIPPGSVFLLDLTHASPSLVMARDQGEELWRRALEAGSPRARLYRGMVEAHPGGGYRIYRLRRSARDLRSTPRHVSLSQADTPFLDVTAGLEAARAPGVEYVVTSSHGAMPERAPELGRFFQELYRQGELVKEFTPEPGVLAGPVLRVFRLRPRSTHGKEFANDFF